MTREELLALPLRELDATVAEGVMGWEEVRVSEYSHRLVGRPNADSPFADILKYSADDNSVRLVRNRIAELGLEDSFIMNLKQSGEKHSQCGYWFEAMQQSPQQQCVAAILAVQEKERGE